MFLSEGLGKHDVGQLDVIFREVNSDLWEGEVKQWRFGYILSTPNKKQIFANDIQKLNRFIAEVYGHENLRDVEELIQDLKFVSYGLVSILLYLKKPDAFNVFLRNVSPVLRSIYPEAVVEIDEFSSDYPKYNGFANRFRRDFGLEPQEVDVVLTKLHREELPPPSTTPHLPPPHKPIAGFDERYIPPILADMPRLAKNDPDLPETSKLFEERVWTIGKMLGYEVEKLGHKRPNERLPDAIFIWPYGDENYAVLVDAKARGQGYLLGTDDRAISEYIRHEFARLQKRGVRRVHYLIVSSSFKGNPTPSINEIRKSAPMCQSICLVTPETLLRILEIHLKDPDFTPKEIDDILLKGGYVGPDDIEYEDTHAD